MGQHLAEPLYPSRAVSRLAPLIGVLAAVAALAGLVWPNGTAPATATSVRGETVEMFARGLYRFDTLFTGAGNRGTDVIVLVLGIPLLALGLVLYRRGSLRGGWLLLGALTFFLYVYASYALGAVAYNELFLVYVVLFSASLFALALTVRSFDIPALSTRLTTEMPRRGPAVFLFISGLVTLLVWLMDPVSSLITGQTPGTLGTATTLFTNALDVAVIVPTVWLAGWLILRYDALGYLIAVPLLVLEAFLLPLIVAQTISQLSAGVEFTAGAIVGPIAGFAVISAAALWFLLTLLRHTPDMARTPRPRARRLDRA